MSMKAAVIQLFDHMGCTLLQRQTKGWWLMARIDRNISNCAKSCLLYYCIASVYCVIACTIIV